MAGFLHIFLKNELTFLKNDVIIIRQLAAEDSRCRKA